MWLPSLAVFIGSLLMTWSVTEICAGLEQTVLMTLERTLDLSFHHMRGLQLDVLAQSQMPLYQEGSDLILQCMGPQICQVAGKGYYFDPYQNKCVKQSLLASVRGSEKPQYPELRQACASGKVFADFVIQKTQQESE